MHRAATIDDCQKINRLVKPNFLIFFATCLTSHVPRLTAFAREGVLWPRMLQGALPHLSAKWRIDA